MIKKSTKAVSALVTVASLASMTPTIAMATTENDNNNSTDTNNSSSTLKTNKRSASTASDSSSSNNDDNESTSSTSSSSSSKKTTSGVDKNGRLVERNGELNTAFAFKDGKAVFDGELEDDKGKEQDEDIYYYNGSLKSLTDDKDYSLSSGDDLKLYGEKYLEVDDGDYYIDLDSGKVTDDELKEDDLTDAKSALRKKFKKDKVDRYVEDAQTEDVSLEMISQNKFQAPWYEGDVRNNDSSEFKYNGKAESYHVYTDIKGNYVDADYELGKITISGSTTTDSAINIRKTTLKNTKGSENNLQAVIKHYKTLGADKDYIYRLADLSVYYTGNVDSSDNSSSQTTTGAGATVDTNSLINVTSTLKFGSKGVEIQGAGDSIRVLQKISKKQSSDDVDDAHIPSSTDTYFVTDKKGRAVGYYDDITIHKGDIITYRVDDDEIQAQVLIPTKDNNFYYLDTSSDDVEIKSDKYAFDTDIDGNLWALGKGKIYQLDKEYEFKEIYKVDGGYDHLSVHDKNNVVAWEDGEDTYAYVGGKSVSEDDDNKSDKDTSDTQDTATQVTTGLITNADGTVSFINADGTKAVGWVLNPANNMWYYFQADGTAKTGWLKDNNKWYFLNADGTMATDWYYEAQHDTWYYLNPTSGEMFGNGWMKNPHDGLWYYLNASGAMQTGWQKINSVWYYFNPISNGYRGSMKTGWVCSNTDGKWYYLNSSGAMLADTTTPDGYKLGADGAWLGN